MDDPKLQLEMERIARTQAVSVYEEMATKFGIAEVPRHIHNGFDAPAIPYNSLHPFVEYIHWTLPGITAATATNYGVIWIAPADCFVSAAKEVHQTKGTDLSAVTLQIEKLTGTEAPDAGVALLNTAFDLKGTINTIQEATMTISQTSGAPYVSLLKDDRLCLKDAGVLTAVANVTVLITITYQ